jgi:hypothetical protein
MVTANSKLKFKKKTKNYFSRISEKAIAAKPHQKKKTVDNYCNCCK